MNTKKKNTMLHDATKRLINWIDYNGWDGWDPYDCREHPLVMMLEKKSRTSLPYKVLNKCNSIAMQMMPLLYRRALGIKSQTNAKGLGLLLASYAILASQSEYAHLKSKAIDIASWLMDNANTSYSGMSWGYPFNWQSCIPIPKGTPSSVVSSTVGDGFYHLYKLTNDQRYLEVCEKICQFFIENLKVTYQEHNRKCRSYTPIDDYQVHNANLFVAEFLARIGKETSNHAYLDEAKELANFACFEQQADGFLPYWGLSQTQTYSSGVINVDHYHSGFEVRCLYQLWKHLGDNHYQKAYQKYYKWYLETLFKDNTPLYKPNQQYPINIHACAESILCPGMLLSDHPERGEAIDETVRWVIKTMEFKSGQYRYLIHNRKGVLFKTNIPMMRWGQGWMLRAFAEVSKNKL